MGLLRVACFLAPTTASSAVAPAQPRLRTSGTRDARPVPAEPTPTPVDRPAVAPPSPAPRDPVHDARSVADAPLPTQASGLARGEPKSAANRWRVLPRALLAVPRLAIEIVDAPIRGALWTYDTYSLDKRAYWLLYSEDGTAALLPVFDVSSDFGVTGGARFFHRDLLGKHERLSVRASYGGLYWQQYSATVSTGDRFGRIRIDTTGEFEIDPRERFFGIGNGDEVGAPATPTDAYQDLAAIDSRFRQTIGRLFARMRIGIAGALSARLSTGALWKRFARSSPGDIDEGDDIAEHYLTDQLPGFERGAAYTYNEIELRHDTRRAASSWEPDALPSTGWLLAGYVGLARGFDRAPTDYERYGVDLQRYFRIAANPRVLVLRGVAEAVAGEESDIPFSDLPRLGGSYLLRGYARDRFRDRAMAMAAAEYQFDLGSSFAGFLFSDVGRVFPSFTEATTRDLRLGFGGGVQLHGRHSYLGRLELASSLDKDLFLHVTLDPVYQPRMRLERD